MPVWEGEGRARCAPHHARCAPLPGVRRTAAACCTTKMVHRSLVHHNMLGGEPNDPERTGVGGLTSPKPSQPVYPKH